LSLLSIILLHLSLGRFLPALRKDGIRCGKENGSIKIMIRRLFQNDNHYKD